MQEKRYSGDSFISLEEIAFRARHGPEQPEQGFKSVWNRAKHRRG